MTSSDKSEFMTETELIPSPLHIEVFQHEPHFTVGIVDAMVQVQCIRKENIVTGKDYGNAFVSIINNLLTDCDEGRLIFDKYLDGSFKEVTRQKRSQHANPVRYRISDEMDFRRISMKSLLSHSSNKDNITHFLKHNILKSCETSPKRMITVCGTKTESNNIHKVHYTAFIKNSRVYPELLKLK